MQSERLSSNWRRLLAEVQELWSKRGVDVLGASDSVALRKVFQRAGFSEERSNREVEEMLRGFDEKLRRAA
jgi:hypothetical protein